MVIEPREKSIRELVIEHRYHSKLLAEAEDGERRARIELQRIEKELTKTVHVDARTTHRIVVVEEEKVMVQVHFRRAGEDPWISFIYPDPEKPGEWTEVRPATTF